eukprot:256163-Amphidinium_carterae.2
MDNQTKNKMCFDNSRSQISLYVQRQPADDTKLPEAAANTSQQQNKSNPSMTPPGIPLTLAHAIVDLVWEVAVDLAPLACVHCLFKQQFFWAPNAPTWWNNIVYVA